MKGEVPMKTVALDVHADVSQMAVVTKDGEVLLEMQVPTRPEDLRRVVAGIPGPKRVVFEEGPMSGLIYDALKDVADEVMSVDPTRNALIGRAEDASDEKDAVRLATLANNRSTREVYVPEEPHRTMRSLTGYDHALADAATAVKNAMKALCRRWAIPCKGVRIYGKDTRDEFCTQLPSSPLRWQFQSLARRLDAMDLERTRAKRTVARLARKRPVIEKLKKIPGVKSVGAPTLVAWIVDPTRFRSRSALASYGGLGLGQGFTNWKPVGRARASKRGNRELKRVLFIAAEAAIKGQSAFARRFQARIAAGWERRKAIRDVARTILFTACAILRTGKEYDDGRVSVPEDQGDDRRVRD
jgi:transposase